MKQETTEQTTGSRSKVFELMVDTDMTTRSIPYSQGLYSSLARAEEVLEKLNLPSWAWSEIKVRNVS